MEIKDVTNFAKSLIKIAKNAKNVAFAKLAKGIIRDQLSLRPLSTPTLKPKRRRRSDNSYGKGEDDGQPGRERLEAAGVDPNDGRRPGWRPERILLFLS